MIPRADRARRVQQRIHAERPQCVAVVGDPRIGKSSFLDGLVAAAAAGDPAPPPGTRFARLDLGGHAGAGPAAFVRAVLDVLRDVADRSSSVGEAEPKRSEGEPSPPDEGRRVIPPDEGRRVVPTADRRPFGAGSARRTAGAARAPLPDEEPCDPGAGPATGTAATENPAPAYAALESELRALARSGGRLILLLDDFDRVTASPDFPAAFFSFLRAQASAFPVAFVTTSRQDLQQLCALREVEESPFFNIFQNLTLGPLDEPSIRALAAERAPSAPAALADWAWAESGGLPAVAVACAELVAGGAAPGDASAAALDERVAPYFAELWAHFDEAHRTLLERLSRGERPGDRDARPLRDLGPRRGYLVRAADGRWTLPSAALRRYLAARAGTRPPGLLARFRRLFGGRP